MGNRQGKFSRPTLILELLVHFIWYCLYRAFVLLFSLAVVCPFKCLSPPQCDSEVEKMFQCHDFPGTIAINTRKSCCSIGLRFHNEPLPAKISRI